VTSHLRNGYVTLVIGPIINNDNSLSDSNTDSDLNSSENDSPETFI